MIDDSLPFLQNSLHYVSMERHEIHLQHPASTHLADEPSIMVTRLWIDQVTDRSIEKALRAAGTS